MVVAGEDTRTVVGKMMSSPSPSSPSSSSSSSSSMMECQNELDKKEREIVRLIKIAEKDRKDSMIYTQRIRKLNEQLQGILIEDLPEDLSYVDHLGTSLPASPSMKIIPSSYEEDENHSPNISRSPSSAPTGTDCQQYERMMKTKDEEYKRVKLRATEESLRATFLKKKEEELKVLLAQETDKLTRNNNEMRQEIAKKEKEIVRLTILAEQNKKAGMAMRDQITKLKKSLEAFINIRVDAKATKLQEIISNCDEGSLSPSSSTVSLQELSNMTSPMNTSPPSPLRQNASALRVDSDSLYRENMRKDGELIRVRAISEAEHKRTNALKNTVEALKEALIEELQSADKALTVKLNEIRTKQEAIQKVSGRVERERSRSCFLRDEIIKLTNALSEEKGEPASLREKKMNSAYTPDVAYLSEFSELGELDPKPLQIDPAMLSDPAQIMNSPPCRSVPISLGSSSECVMFTQKMKDLELLEKEKAKKDEELVRLKRLAEAERCRHLLLKEKMQELKDELKSMKTREISRTL